MLPAIIAPVINCIEGYPFIIRFKTPQNLKKDTHDLSIEGYPFIIRFKTNCCFITSIHSISPVLRVIHL